MKALLKIGCRLRSVPGRIGGEVLFDHQRHLEDDGVIEVAQIKTGDLADLFQTVDQRVAVDEQAAAGLGDIQVVLKESLDEETLFTIQKFFENNLNVSETSRKLFVHRNTLVYRLEKIKRLTGLDLREFDDAIVFKVALMVRKYLSSRDIR